ncbi:MAG: hypothetical protein JWQ98_3395 [Chlorobi bacterium]|nr:hypothetical protein [Chlorobiota bacterium]
MRDEIPPGLLLRSPEALKGPGLKEETVLGLEGARVLYANYDLLRHDFPQLGTGRMMARFPELAGLAGEKLRRAMERRIDFWVVRNCAYISGQQAGQTEVNTPIPCSSRRVRAYRPLKYGRALVLSLANNRAGDSRPVIIERGHEDGLIDVKGTGCAPGIAPAAGAHRDGLLKLSDALIELLNQRLIQRIFRHSGSEFQTIPIYAIIDPGFRITEENNAAAILVRRAHRRQPGSGGLARYGSVEQIIQLEIELLLRRYGISSCNPITRVKMWRESDGLKIEYGRTPITFLTDAQLATLERVGFYDGGTVLYDGVNVQHTREVGLHPSRAHVVDFGTYRVFERFDNPVLSLVWDRLLRWGGTIRPGTSRWPDPDPAIRISYEMWGAPGGVRGYPAHSNHGRLDVLCNGLAEDYMLGRLSAADVMAVVDDFLDESTAHWLNGA